MNINLFEHWDDFFTCFSDGAPDIYFTECYVTLYRSEYAIPCCLVCQEDEKVMLFPMLKKEIQEYWDFETPYGYGGPIANTEDKEWCNKALDEMVVYLRKAGCVCGFFRFHPLLHNEELCISKFSVLYDRPTIAINTRVSEEEIWNTQITSKNRNMIRKAIKNNLEYRAEFDFASIDEFVKLYNRTMERLSAEAFYFFDMKYYDKFISQLAGHAFLGTVRKDDQLICAALFMYSQDYGHYHLEGSDGSFSGANNYLLWMTALEMHRMGIKEFHLGGGSDPAEDNSLLKFKKSFSHNEKCFHIGKAIYNEEVYRKLCTEWEAKNPEKAPIYKHHLLRYRY